MPRERGERAAARRRRPSSEVISPGIVTIRRSPRRAAVSGTEVGSSVRSSSLRAGSLTPCGSDGRGQSPALEMSPVASNSGPRPSSEPVR